jgi:hypothetical protein
MNVSHLWHCLITPVKESHLVVLVKSGRIAGAIMMKIELEI